MAKPTGNIRSKSSNQHYDNNTMEARPTILASCYTVDASTAALKGFHYSTTGVPGAQWYA